MKKEWHIFLTAVMFFTRIPVGNIPYSEDYLNKSSKYLPVIGWLTGGTGALVFWGASYILPPSVAVLLSMVATILLTGAFHEDGFTDVCDGIGGGWTKDKILEIMKDSRIGAYGMIGMFFMLTGKFIVLSEINVNLLPLVIFTGHTLSRYFATHFMYKHRYVRDDITSKAKPVGKKIKTPELILSVITGFIPFLLFPSIKIIIIIPLVFIAYYFFSQYIKKWIGGYTGDCLGAMQQVTELTFYIAVLVYDGNLKNILW
ncbi:MAG: adenosylcobinamide-GDP ribazoletransferase [Bacteroidales bacterium]